jgi:hypothetical protein
MKAVVVILIALAIPANIGVALSHNEVYCKADNAVRELVGETYVSPYCD